MNLIITNQFMFLYGTIAIFLLQLFAIMIVLYIGFALIAWPIRYFMRSMLQLMRSPGHL